MLSTVDTSHSAYVARSTKLHGVKIDGFLYPNFMYVYSGFFENFLYQSGVKSTVFWVFEELKFKICEGYDQNWFFPDSAQLAVSV